MPEKTEGQRERRRATVLFADLSGFTKLSEGLDPEDVTDITSEIFRRFEAIIKSYDGHLDKTMGDAVMAVFGAPTAHEDDPIRAIHCAIEMQKAIAAFNRDTQAKSDNPPLQMRVGINTGEIVTGKPTEKERFTVIGDAVNVAQRLESIAAPGTILVGRETQKLAEERFFFIMMAAVQVKNRTEAVQPYAVTGVRDVKALQTRRILLQSAMVGRDRELMRLKAAFAMARDGRTSRCVAITGDAGTGKSRLLYEFSQWITDEPYLVNGLRGRCMPYGGAPLAPFRDMIRGEYGIKVGMDPAECRKKLTDGMTPRLAPLVAGGRIHAGYEQENLIHLVGLMVGVDFPGARILSLPIDRRREEGFHAIRMLLEAFIYECPLVVMIEDMHWADESTAALLSYLLEKLKDQPVMLLVAARNQIDEKLFAKTLMSNPAIERVNLAELGKADLAALVEKLLGGPVEEKLLSEIEHRTAGNPYFVEEIVRFAVEKGIAKNVDGRWCMAAVGRAGAAVVLPDTLDGLLVARIDELPTGAKETIRSASVVGRSFWERAVEELAQRTVTAELDMLRRSELIYRRPLSMLEGEAEHVFKHMLLRDAAYRTLSKKERPALHGKVAEWIEQRLEGAPGELVQLAAYHNAEAGRPEKAVKHWERAGDLARDAGQLDDAVNCYTAAMHLIVGDAGLLPLLEKRADVCGLKGQFDRVTEDLEEGLRLLGSGARQEHTAAECRARLLRKLATNRQKLGQIDEARRLLALALEEVEGKDVPEEVMVILGHGWLEGAGVGNCAEGERLTKKAVEIVGRMSAVDAASREERDRLLVTCRMNLGTFALGLGELSVAERMFAEVLDHHEKCGDRGGLAKVLGNMGILCFSKGEHDRALEFIEKARNLFELIGDRGNVAVALGNTALSYSAKGETDQAEEFLTKALGICEQTGWLPLTIQMSRDMGNICLRKGKLDAALESYGKYFRASELIRDRSSMAMASCCIGTVHQARGDRMVKDGRTEEARKEWQKAVEWASRGLKVATEIGAEECVAAGHGAMGEALWALGEKSRGLDELRLALAKYDELGMKGNNIDDLRATIKEREGH
jgi:adenylate cyclase